MTREKAEKIARGIENKIECCAADIDGWAEFWGFTREEYEEFLETAVNVIEREQKFLDAGYKNGRVEFMIGGRKFMVKEMAQ